MISFQINKRFSELVVQDKLDQAVQAALKHEKQTENVEMSLVLTTDREVQRLNRRFRGEIKSTDVLSFPSDEEDKETGARYLGDIVISVPLAQAQAAAAGHPLEAELQLLAVHGVLHLVGHDHGTVGEKAKMWKAQDEILEGLGLPMRSAQAEIAAKH